MAARFFDTNAAAKHYRVELGTAKVDAFLTEVGALHFLSALGVVEVHSVFARLTRTGHITAADHGGWPMRPVSARMQMVLLFGTACGDYANRR
jgi:hypothetical protein